MKYVFFSPTSQEWSVWTLKGSQNTQHKYPELSKPNIPIIEDQNQEQAYTTEEEDRCLKNDCKWTEKEIQTWKMSPAIFP